MSRSLSASDINKRKGGIRKSDSFFRVIPSTPRVKTPKAEVSSAAAADDHDHDDGNYFCSVKIH